MNALAELYAVVREAWREGDWRGHLRAWLRVISNPEVSESRYRPCLRSVLEDIRTEALEGLAEWAGVEPLYLPLDKVSLANIVAWCEAALEGNR